MGDESTAPYAGFEGRIGRTMAGSEPSWPARPTPPDGAPNIVIVLVDDVGFSDLGCYGGEIRTPNLDRLAAGGIRFANFHVNPMCSPTRAALLTGVNAHAAGVGHVSQDDPGYPGYRGELAANVATAAEILRDAGYATLAVGKWHLCRDADCSAAGPKHSWPVQRGFERYYGFLEGFTNLHHPHQLIDDNHAVERDAYPEGYFLTDDLTDRAITFVKERKAANPLQPFFLYLAHGAAHAPLVAKAEDIERYESVYAVGWDEIRRRRHERQIELGLLEPGTVLPPRNSEPGDDVTPWDELSGTEQAVFARYMAVYAAMVDELDQSVGKLRATLETMGEWENTVLVFLSDNGASREGQSTGTTNYYSHLRLGADVGDVELDAARIDFIGSPRTMSHYPRGWAMASNTPFRLYKCNTHAGGHQVPCIWHWPAGLEGQAGTTRAQYGHCVDVLPTVLDLIGLRPPGERDGRPMKPMNGGSLAPLLRDGEHEELRREQYYELQGNLGFYADGWEIVTRRERQTPFADADWELYDLRIDPTETNNLAAAHPDKVAEIAARFTAAARENQVYPLDEGSAWRWVVRPPHDSVFEQPVTLWPGTPTLDRWRSSRLIWFRSCTITIALTVEGGDRGVLLAHGDQGGGYAVYIDDDRVFAIHNDGHGRLHTLDGGAIAPGEHIVTLAIEAPGNFRWHLALGVDGTLRARLDGLAMLFPMAPFEGIDVGIDRRSPVCWELYEREGPFPFTGDLAWVRYEPGELAPDAGERFLDVLKEMGARFE
ncbi:MAG: arylsulfatase [Acidimicrobiia bacterium]